MGLVVRAPTAAEILSLLKRLSQTLDLACLYISHDLMTVQDFCDRIAVIYLGQIVELGTRAQIFEGSIHPYTLASLASRLIPDVAGPRVNRAESIKLQGEIPSAIDLPRGCHLFGRCPMQQPRCGEERQLLTAMPDGRQVRCWRAVAGETAGSTMTAI